MKTEPIIFLLQNKIEKYKLFFISIFRKTNKTIKMAKSTIINPLTGRHVVQGGRIHLKLIRDRVLEDTTLDLGKISIVEGSRQKMEEVKVEYTTRSTHWLNIREIAKAIHVSEWEMLEWFSKEYEEMKICYSQKNIRVIFPNKEFFLQDAVNEYIKENSKKKKLDITDWNQ